MSQKIYGTTEKLAGTAMRSDSPKRQLFIDRHTEPDNPLPAQSQPVYLQDVDTSGQLPIAPLVSKKAIGADGTNDIGARLFLLKPMSALSYGIRKHFAVVFSKPDEYVSNSVGRGFFSWFAFKGTSPIWGASGAISVSCKMVF